MTKKRKCKYGLVKGTRKCKTKKQAKASMRRGVRLQKGGFDLPSMPKMSEGD